MEMLLKINLILHVIAGVSTLVAGPIAIFFNEKNSPKHRLAGKIFFYAMNFVCFSGIVGYFRHPSEVFYQFLMGISVFVWAGIFRGVRAIQFMKGSSRVRWFDFAYSIALLFIGGWMVRKGLQNWLGGGFVAFTILFCVFGIGSLKDAVENLSNFFQPQKLDKLDWYRLHVGTMLGAFTASTTAFTVNVAHFLPWYIQWFGPTILLVPLQIFFARKIKNRKKLAAA